MFRKLTGSAILGSFIRWPELPLVIRSEEVVNYPSSTGPWALWENTCYLTKILNATYLLKSRAF